MATIGRHAYAEMFGPTVGDRLRLADTDLLIEVEVTTPCARAAMAKRSSLAAEKPSGTAWRSRNAPTRQGRDRKTALQGRWIA